MGGSDEGGDCAEGAVIVVWAVEAVFCEICDPVSVDIGTVV
jgi:hypothetical protein